MTSTIESLNTNMVRASRLPAALVWSQEFDDRGEAKETERRLKGWSRAKKEALIENKFELISILASRSAGNRALRDGRRP
jgi:predicted GIY-YIG superfamily endonuclease